MTRHTRALFAPIGLVDVTTLLRAWRYWLLAGIVGAVIAALMYWILPPPFRAQATVLVDFNLEQAWPQDTDRQFFYYLEREARKLEEVAWSDAVLQEIVTLHGGSLEALRGGQLHLSQPGEGGWHLYADAPAPGQAGALASTWADAFTTHARELIGQSDGLNSFIEIEATQSERLPVARSVGLATYLLAGALGALVAAALVSLYLGPWLGQPSRPGAAPLRRRR